MDLTPVIIVAGLFLFYSLFSKRLETTSLTAPMIFTSAGLLIGLFWKDLFGDSNMNHGTVHLLAEVTLIFVLFTDAARINFKTLQRDHILPQRMLIIGLPLTIIFGTLAAYFLFGRFLLWEAALLAAILAPTDAALGQAVVSSEDVPIRIRQTLGVESGLNDGFALPAVLIFASLASAAMADHSGLYWVQFTFLQIVLGPLAGVVIGFIGAKLIDLFTNKKWISKAFEGICALSIALIAFTAAELIGGNGFISAFVGGLSFGHFLSHRCEFLYEFAESEGQFFTLTTFLIFGTIAIHLIGDEFYWTYVLYAILSLTIIRMLPIAVSLIGTKVNKYTVLFLGWFGPRGLASILFALLILEKMEIVHSGPIISTVIITVLMSVFLHGITAFPASRKYGSIIRKAGECEEMKPVSETGG
ncbi:MAG: sodium:proton antiporter [Pyrinomonadaceae bacterium]|nr:sodium:proton antiporter [Pyrinomonadaceae bacterium]